MRINWFSFSLSVCVSVSLSLCLNVHFWLPIFALKTDFIQINYGSNIRYLECMALTKQHQTGCEIYIRSMFTYRCRQRCNADDFNFYIKDIFEMSLLCLRWQAIINHIHQCPIGSGFVFHITRNVQRIWKSLEYLWLELLCCCANISQSNAVPDSNISWINVLYWLVVWACLLLMMIPWSTSFQATEFQNWSRYACNFG